MGYDQPKPFANQNNGTAEHVYIKKEKRVVAKREHMYLSKLIPKGK